ncbi:TerD domain-containing protein [Cladochytrium replicatum]|nr:TerD domain-containing protein [Cladochytrium replicatum]
MAKKGKVVDLDASVAALNDAGAIIDSVSFKKLTGMNGAVRHSGDDRSGDGDGDDEVITFNTNALNPEFSRFVIVINSFTLVPLSQTRSAYVRVSSPYKGTVAFFRINSFTNNTGLLLGQLWRTSEGWFFSSGKESGPGRTITESMSWVIPHATGSHGAKAISPQPNAFVDNTAQHYGAPPTPPGVQGYTGPQPGQTPPLQGYGVPPSAAGYTSPQGYAQGYGQPYGTAPAGQGYYAPQVHGYYSPPQGNYAPSLQGYAQQGAQQQYHAPPPGAPQGYYGDPQGYPGARQ